MSSDDLSILETRETIFYGDHDGNLCQWITLTIESRLDVAVQATVLIAAEDDEVTTPVTIMPGDTRVSRLCTRSLAWLIMPSTRLLCD